MVRPERDRIPSTGCPSRDPPTTPGQPCAAPDDVVAGLVRRLVRPLADARCPSTPSRLRIRCAWASPSGRRVSGIDGPAGVKRTTPAPLPGVPDDPRSTPAGSIARKAAALRRYFAWLVRTGTLTTDPTVGLQARGGDGRLPRVLDRARPRRAARGRAARGRAGLAAPARRRRARGAVRLGPPGQRAVRARHVVARPRPARRSTCGARAPRSAGCRCRHRRSRALRRVAGVRHDVLVDDAAPSRPAGRCSATSGASRSPRATCAGSSTAARRRRRTRTRSATASPPTCSTAAPTCAPCRSCSATPTSPRRSATPTSAASASARPTSTPIPEHEGLGPSARHEHRRRRSVPGDAVGPLAQAAQLVGPRPPDRLVRPARQVRRRPGRRRAAVERRSRATSSARACSGSSTPSSASTHSAA